MRGALEDFFAAQAPAMAAQITAARDRHAEKIAKDAPGPDPDPALVEAIIAELTFDAWGDLAGALEPILLRIAEDGILVAFQQIGVTPTEEITNQVNAAAVAWAQARAAELVGMRRQADGTLIQNPNAQWAITDTTRDELRQAVTTAITEGTSTADLAAQLADAYAFSDTRAELIARTELAHADVQGNLLAYRESGQVEGKEAILSPDHEGPDDCDDAEAMGVVPLDSDFGGLGDPPFHPRCFLPDTLVAAAGITAHYRHWFAGEVVSVRTERQDFTATPNHPVLTARGWVAAQALQVGDLLFECADPATAVRLMDPDDHQVPIRIEEVARALLVAGGMTTAGVPSAAEDFHGDGLADGEVDVVWAARALVANPQPGAPQDGGHGPLARRHRAPTAFAPQRQSAQLLEGDGATPDGGVRRRGESLALVGAEACTAEQAGGAHAADGEPVPLEQVAQGGTVAVELLRECDGGLARFVQPVEILEIRKRQFAGHVYNLSTKAQWYFANGIVTHNCECDIVPVLIPAAQS